VRGEEGGGKWQVSAVEDKTPLRSSLGLTVMDDQRCITPVQHRRIGRYRRSKHGK